MKKILSLALLAFISACVPTVTPAPTATLGNTSIPSGTFTPTRTNTPIPSSTFTPVSSQTFTPTRTNTLAPTHTPGVSKLKYYLVDRVLSNPDFATLAGWGINTAVVDIGINDSTASWQSVLTAASNAGVNIIIWPNQGGDVAGCGWETPFDSPQNGNYIWRVTSMLDFWAGNPHVDGIVIAHEPAGEQFFQLS